MKKTILAMLIMAAVTPPMLSMVAAVRPTYAEDDAATAEGATSSNSVRIQGAGPPILATVLAQSDADSNPANAPVLAYDVLGLGRAVITGDCSWFCDTYRSLGDNELLLLNSFSWLSLGGVDIIWIESTNYHSQYSIDDAYYDGLKELLIANGYTITKYTGTITDAELSGYDIVAITNTGAGCGSDARDFAVGEIDAIENFVSSGNGLFLAAENPDYGNNNFDPIGVRFGVIFDDVVATDPTNNYINDYWPIIHVFNPHAVTSGVSNFYYITGCSLSGPIQTVIPEVPLGTIMLSLSMMIALIGFAGIKRFRAKPQL